MAKPFYVMNVLKRLAASAATLTVLCTFASHADEVDLLAYMRDQIEPAAVAGLDQTAIPPYDRGYHFGGWKKQDDANPCQTTRATVLKRQADASVPLVYKNSYHCTVATGLWHDAYTGRDIRRAGELQIDHIVPLKAAYYAGAHAWTNAVRCHYANFIANDYHLGAVDAHENMAKSDKGPEEYLPPNPADHCRYVNAWMKVKAIWNLRTTEKEVTAIYQVFRQQSCQHLMRYMDSADLTAQRRMTASPIPACEGRPE